MAERDPRIHWRRVDGIVLLDKPLGVSSNTALQSVRRLFRAEKGGHTGALDPLATGLLPICLGEATKISGLLLNGDKHYRATVRLGWTTTTGDGEGEALQHSDPSQLSIAALEAAAHQFLGPISQVPPMHSALKQGGQPLYKLAREGIEIERAPRSVHIHELAITDFDGQSFVLDVLCSKGTYIRTLAEDIAHEAGQCAHLSALRRLGAAPFDSAVMVSQEELELCVKQRGEAALFSYLLSPAAGVAHVSRIQVTAEQGDSLTRGQTIIWPAPLAGPVAVLDSGGQLMGMAEVQEGRIKPRRWFQSSP